MNIPKDSTVPLWTTDTISVFGTPVDVQMLTDNIDKQLKGTIFITLDICILIFMISPLSVLGLYNAGSFQFLKY